MERQATEHTTDTASTPMEGWMEPLLPVSYGGLVITEKVAIVLPTQRMNVCHCP